MFSEWLAREVSNITGQFSRPYFKNRFPEIDYIELEEWFKKERPDLSNMSLYDAIRKMKSVKALEKS